MKNKKLILGLALAACLAFTGCGNNASVTDEKSETTVASVSEEITSSEETVSVEEVSPEDIEVEEETVLEEVPEENKYRISSVTTISNGEEYGTVPYEYDEQGRLIKVGTMVYEYDENGNPTTIYYYLDDACTQVWYKDLYEFDSENRKIKYTPIGYDMFTGKENVNDFETYEYDDQGRLSKLIRYWGQIVVDYGKPYSEQHYQYDESGKLTELAYVNPTTGESSSKDIYEYDSFGNLITVKTVEMDGTIFREVKYTYDSEGRETSKTTSYYWDGVLEVDTIETSEYDAEGRLVRVTTESVSYEYTESSVFEYELIP